MTHDFCTMEYLTYIQGNTVTLPSPHLLFVSLYIFFKYLKQATKKIFLFLILKRKNNLNILGFNYICLKFSEIYAKLFSLYLNSINICRGLTHLCPPLRSTFAVRETAPLGIMGAPRVPPLNPSESIVL